MAYATDQLRALIQCAQSRREADLVIHNARIFHLATGEFESADIAVVNGVIAGIGEDYHGRREIDARGMTAVPGFIDAHVHLESSVLAPNEYERLVLPHGITTAVCDPHELANVVGEKAFEYLYECRKSMIMDLVIRLSSCVPASPFETSGAHLTAQVLAKWHRMHPEAGLAEFMNFPGVLNCDPEVLEKLSLFDDIDGHAPLLGGKALNAYVAAGVRNCHECSSAQEAMEKIRRGMAVFIREGGVARNLDALMPIITVENSPFIAFCTDDRNPLDIVEGGHIERSVARAIAAGAPPLAAYRAACSSAAALLHLDDRGLIAPGRRADILLLSDFKNCVIDSVLVGGQLVNDALLAARPPMPDSAMLANSVKCRKVTADDFRVHSTRAELPVIRAIPNSLLTGDFTARLPRDGENVLADPSQDILKLAVVERHGVNGNIGRGFVQGLGLKHGAVASSVGHDAHNLCVAGARDEDMALAINAIIDMQGGFAVINDGQVLATLPLPLAGLLTPAPAREAAAQLRHAKEALARLGCTLSSPFLQLAFLPLSVIPTLKLTDKGIVDVVHSRIIPLE